MNRRDLLILSAGLFLPRAPHKKLHTIYGRNRYCGPAAMSTIIGISTDRAAQVIGDWSGRKPVTATSYVEMEYCLGEYGWKMSMNPIFRGRISFPRWINSPRDMTNYFLVSTINHWIAVRGSWLADSFNRVPTTIRRFRKKDRTITTIWQVWKDG